MEQGRERIAAGKAVHCIDVTRGRMKSFAEISGELRRLEAFDLEPGDWVWLRAAALV